ncbi:hypothetical protein SCUCBS95973_004719 [Sporothrix curviconia]|uniref:DUF7719 domain-containing protein n=1 Tax=Sporothrix curviconia TaxID=1260050 RepID=A0ABP0BR24_9PEZI
MAKKTRKGAASSSGSSAAPDIDAAGIRLMQPDRSGPSGKTLLDFAGGQNLFQQADARQRQLNKERGLPLNTGIVVKKASSGQDNGSDDDNGDGADEDNEPAISPFAERILDTTLWCVSIAMLHFTLDVLVQNQYAIEIEWPVIVRRSLQALGVFSLLFYNLHRHASDPRLLPLRLGLPLHVQDRLRQAVFFVTSSLTGCYLIYITNEYSYIAVLMQAPPLGCLWVWSVVEMDLLWAVPSLVIAVTFMLYNGYGI